MIRPSVSARRVLRCLRGAGLAAAAVPVAEVHAQIIRGKVVEFRSDLAVAGAQITLLDAKQRELDVATRTDSVGMFVLRVPAPGRYIVRSRRLGYDEFLSIPKDVKATDTVSVNLWPEANGQLLDSILTLAGRAPIVTGKAFAARQRAGHGQFIDRATILKERYRDLEQALTHGLQGLEIRRQTPLMGMCYQGCCSFSIYHNGLPTLISDNQRQVSRQLEQDLSMRATNLYGIEVFIGRNQIPMEYRDASRNSCGVLAIWTHPPD